MKNVEHLQVPTATYIRKIPDYLGARFGEHPHYRVLSAEAAGIELRGYGEAVLVETVVPGNPELAWEEGFQRITDYLLGKNIEDIKIDVPIESPLQLVQREGSCLVSLALPVEYNLLTAPKPLNFEVGLVSAPEKETAVIAFQGSRSAAGMDRHASVLLEWLDGQTRVLPISELRWAQYRMPFLPRFLMRNEVQVDVRLIPADVPLM